MRWPASTALIRADHGNTLTLFLHPKCPCSRASIAELEKLFGYLQQRGTTLPTTYVVATLPESESTGWLDTQTVHRAAKLPGAQVLPDRGGREASRFGAVTSGTVMVFDATGRRLYAGGITPARGMEGDNAGHDAIQSILEGRETSVSNTPVFGCVLCLPHSPPQPENLANNNSQAR